jgi:hypothetical protein
MPRPLSLALLAAGFCLAAVFLIDSGRSRPPASRRPPTPVERPADQRPASKRIAVDGETLGEAVRESAGAWGTLQCYPIFIAAPEAILEQFPLPSAVTTWTFLGLSADEVADVIDRPGLPEQARAELLDRNRWREEPGRMEVSPSHAALFSLPGDVRAGIYNVLARWEDNEFQHSPYFVPGNDVRRWLAVTGLRQELVDLIARTAYPVGEAVYFSDLPLAIAATTSHAEARSLLRALSRTESVILRLRLDDASDLERIRGYWSAGAANAKDFLPLLESVAANPRINHLDLVHLLPPTARRLLYTFPRPSLAVGGRYPDCHWTSLNFFRDRPEPRLIDTDGATLFARENFRVGAPPPTYGDIMFFTTGDGNAIHSCVYLADGWVFTKNGANVLSPWLIMRLDEVRERYSRRGPVEVVIYRAAEQAG